MEGQILVGCSPRDAIVAYSVEEGDTVEAAILDQIVGNAALAGAYAWWRSAM